MPTNKVITNFQNINDALLNETSSTIIHDCTGNVNFTFTGGALTAATAAQTDYHNKLAAVALGGTMAVTAKDLAKTVLTNALQILALQVNLQANGDITKLQSSGIPLVQQGSSQTMPVPTGAKVDYNNVSGSVDVSVSKPNVSDHGTIFAYWDTSLGAYPQNPYNWRVRHANGHSFTLTDLTVGTVYVFCCAYKGKDTDALIWGDRISKMII
jgi:hypothetical protein